jgi:hypothetical protein
MSTALSWGPSTWYILHTLSLTYTPELMHLYIKFLRLISQTIPCMKCRRHFNMNLVKTGGIMKNLNNKNQMIKWITDLHNMVNKSNKKREYSYNDAIQLYYNNDNLIYRKNLFITFLREYVIYNFKFSKHKSIEIMKTLGQIFPFKNRRKMFIKMFRKNDIRTIGLLLWLKKYKKILI